MKIIAKYFEDHHPPLLQLFIHDAPHYRMHVATIQQYRGFLVAACARAGVAMPIEHPIDLSVIFINPSSPDNGNLYLALERALDGNTLRKPAVLVDDSLICDSHIRKMFTGGVKK